MMRSTERGRPTTTDRRGAAGRRDGLIAGAAAVLAAAPMSQEDGIHTILHLEFEGGARSTP